MNGNRSCRNRDADGTHPAKEYMLASLARKIIRHRRMLGLSQAELARRAGIRPETLNRIEQGKHSPSVADRGEDRPGIEEGGGGGRQVRITSIGTAGVMTCWLAWLPAGCIPSAATGQASPKTGRGSRRARYL